MPGYRLIPDFLRKQILHCSSNTFYIGRTRSFTTTSVESGELAHLGISWNGQSVTHSAAFVPPASNGRWSKYNVDGQVHLRRDLPKVEKTIGGWESPNFGDWSRGSHTHFSTRSVFQRETWYAQSIPLLIDADEPSDDRVTIGFRVDRVFDRTDLNERDLKLAASLLRENLNSHAGVVASSLSVIEWLANQRVEWEILPRGEASFERTMARLGGHSSTPRFQEMKDRYTAVDGMKPASIIVGQGEFSKYFGFKFRDDLVVLENLDYGNAMYVMYDDWDVLSKRSRTQLLSDSNANYNRIVHRSGWEIELRNLLELKGHDVSAK